MLTQRTKESEGTFEFKGGKHPYRIINEGPPGMKQKPSWYSPEEDLTYVSESVPDRLREYLLQFAINEYQLKESGATLHSVRALSEEYKSVPLELRREYLEFRRKTFAQDEQEGSSEEQYDQDLHQERLCLLFLHAVQ